MSRHLPRKRNVQPQDEPPHFQRSHTSVPILNGKRFRWFQKAVVRRIRLLFSLLHRYPVVVLFLFLIIWKGLQLTSIISLPQFPSIFKSPFQHELTMKGAERFLDKQLIESFGQQHLQRFSNLRDTPHGIFMDVQLHGVDRGVLKLSKRDISTDASQLEATPQVHKLAQLLHLQHAFAKSYRIRLSIVLHEPLADRHTMKALCRACGFRSPSKVPDGATIIGDVLITDPKSLRFTSALHTPTIEPYDWTCNLPTSSDCGDATFGQTLNSTAQRQCRRLAEVMIVMYLAGCAPPSSDAFAQWYSDDERNSDMFQMAFPGGCFGKYKDNSILLDILAAYIRTTCSLPSGLLRLIKQLRDVGWGVSRRAEMLGNQLLFLDKLDDGCRTKGWQFYEAGVD